LEQNRLFVTYKPSNISSNRYLSTVKKRYGVKKAGFSGTLDPFAKGVLIVAFGQYTKLFRFLKKSPKRYRATLWLGAESETLDMERIATVKTTTPSDVERIKEIFESLIGDIEYLPPKFSAKKIKGVRAYDLMREGKDVELKSIITTIYDIKLLHYSHPFITFEIEVSEGGYIRSIGKIIAEKLETVGALSSLERLSEGEFKYEDERALNPLPFLNLKENFYLGDRNDLILGRKLSINYIKIKKNGNYFINLDTILSIISITDEKVKYILNGVKLC
jgi:tRNA pseudouridine55 synthase